MFAAVARSTRNAVESVAALQTRGEVLARYRRLRAISVQHHSKTMKLVSRDCMLRNARRLGLAQGTVLILDDMEDMNLVFDLSIHTAEPGRSRAIDRYARSAKLPPGSDEALVLDAMCRARFSLIQIERRHPSAGLIAKDRVRGTEHWLVDEGLESSTPDGFVLATRLFTLDSFSMNGRRVRTCHFRIAARCDRGRAAIAPQDAAGVDRRPPFRGGLVWHGGCRRAHGAGALPGHAGGRVSG